MSWDIFPYFTDLKISILLKVIWYFFGQKTTPSFSPSKQWDKHFISWQNLILAQSEVNALLTAPAILCL